MRSWISKRHDGVYQGKRYFSCANGRGTFVPRSHVSQVLKLPDYLKHLPPEEIFRRDPRTGKVVDVEEKIKELEQKELQEDSIGVPVSGQKVEDMNIEEGDRLELQDGRLGTVDCTEIPSKNVPLALDDRVRLRGNRTGVVKYVGNLKGSSDGEVEFVARIDCNVRIAQFASQFATPNAGQRTDDQQWQCLGFHSIATEWIKTEKAC